MDEHVQMTTSPDSIEERPTEPLAPERGWEALSSQAMRVLPRLREIATTAVLLSPIIVSPDFYGGGGVRGC